MGERDCKGLFLLALAEMKIGVQFAKPQLHCSPPGDQNEDECRRGPREKIVAASNFTSIYSLIFVKHRSYFCKIEVRQFIQENFCFILVIALIQHHLVDQLLLSFRNQLVFVNRRTCSPCSVNDVSKLCLWLII